jgi:hypothetical protein
MGRTQCFRANIAYSLYGVKKGSNNKGACNQAHYINSFFTTTGVEAFGDAIGVDYSSSNATSACTYEQIAGDAYDGNQDYSNDDDETSFEYMMYTNYLSYGTGCSSSGEFIQAQFQGAYCDGYHYVATTNTMSNFNSNLDSLGCLSVYSSRRDYSNSASNLLAYSSSCSLIEYPTRCPDPHGIKNKRDMTLYKSALSHQRTVSLGLPILSTIMLILSFYMFWRSAVVRKRLENSMDPMDNPSDLAPNRFEKAASKISQAASRSVSEVSRSMSHMSEKTRSFKEKLQEYAEEEEVMEDFMDYSTQSEQQEPASVAAASAATAPTTEKEQNREAQVVVEDAPYQEDPIVVISNAEVANAILAEKGVPADQQSSVPYKRPRLARLSKFLFGKKSKKKATRVQV